MHLPSHLILSWLVGHRLVDRRDRVLVAWAGVSPDLDAISVIAGEELYGLWHHVLTHGISAAVIVAGLSAIVAKKRLPVFLLAFLAFHLHLLTDLLGSGRAWPVVYFFPFNTTEYFSPYGWPLASWQNVSITICAIITSGYIGVRRGHTFAECFLPSRADGAIVETLRRRFSRT